MRANILLKPSHPPSRGFEMRRYLSARPALQTHFARFTYHRFLVPSSSSTITLDGGGSFGFGLGSVAVASLASPIPLISRRSVVCTLPLLVGRAISSRLSSAASLPASAGCGSVVDLPASELRSGRDGITSSFT